ANLLEALAKSERNPSHPPDLPGATFGGDATRSHVLRAAPEVLDRISKLCREGPTYRFSLESGRALTEELVGPGRGVPDSVRARSLAFYPVLAGPYLLVADARFVRAHDLRSGEGSIWFDLASGQHGLDLKDLNLRLPAPPDLRYTLTVAGG